MDGGETSDADEIMEESEPEPEPERERRTSPRCRVDLRERLASIRGYRRRLQQHQLATRDFPNSDESDREDLMVEVAGSPPGSPLAEPLPRVGLGAAGSSSSTPGGSPTSPGPSRISTFLVSSLQRHLQQEEAVQKALREKLQVREDEVAELRSRVQSLQTAAQEMADEDASAQQQLQAQLRSAEQERVRLRTRMGAEVERLRDKLRSAGEQLTPGQAEQLQAHQQACEAEQLLQEQLRDADRREDRLHVQIAELKAASEKDYERSRKMQDSLRSDVTSLRFRLKDKTQALLEMEKEKEVLSVKVTYLNQCLQSAKAAAAAPGKEDGDSEQVRSLRQQLAERQREAAQLRARVAEELEPRLLLQRGRLEELEVEISILREQNRTKANLAGNPECSSSQSGEPGVNPEDKPGNNSDVECITGCAPQCTSSALREQIEELVQRLADQDKELDQLRETQDDLSATQEEVSKLTTELGRLETERSELRAALVDLKSSSQEALAKAEREMKEAIQVKEDEIGLLKKEMGVDVGLSREEMQSELEKVKRDTGEALEEQLGEISRLWREGDDLILKLEEMEEVKQTLSETVKAQQVELEDLKRAKTEWMSGVQSILDTYDKDLVEDGLPSRLRSCEDDVKRLVQTVSETIRTHDSRLTAEKECLEKELKRLQAHLSATQDEMHKQTQGFDDAIQNLRAELEEKTKSLDVLRTDLEVLQRDKRAEQSEVEQLSQQNAALQDQLVVLSTANEKQEAELKALRISQKNLQDGANTLETWKKNLQEKVDTLEIDNSALVKGESALRKDLERLQAEKNNLCREMDVLINDNQVLRDELGSVREENADLTATVQDALSQSAELENRNKTLEKENEEALDRSRILEGQDKVKELQAQVDSSSQEIARLRESLAQKSEIEAENSALNDKLEVLHSLELDRKLVMCEKDVCLEAAKKTIEELRQEIYEKNGLITEHNFKLSEKDICLETMFKSIEEQRQEINGLQSEKKVLMAEKESFKTSLTNLRGKVNVMEALVKINQETNAKLKLSQDKVSSLAEIDQETNAKLKLSQDKVNSLENEIEKLQTELSSAIQINETIVEHQQQIDTLQSELKDLTEENVSLSEELREQTSALEALRETNQQSTNTLRESQHQVISLQEEIDKLQAELSSVQSQQNSSQETERSLRAEVARLTTAVDSKSQRCQKLNSQLRSCVEEMDDVRKKLAKTEQLESALKKANEESITLTIELHAKTKQLENQQQLENERVRRNLSEALQFSNSQQAKLQEQKQDNEQLRRAMSENASATNELQAKLHEEKQENERLRRTLSETANEINELQAKLAAEKDEIKRLTSSLEKEVSKVFLLSKAASAKQGTGGDVENEALKAEIERLRLQLAKEKSKLSLAKGCATAACKVTMEVKQELSKMVMDRKSEIIKTEEAEAQKTSQREVASQTEDVIEEATSSEAARTDGIKTERELAEAARLANEERAALFRQVGALEKRLQEIKFVKAQLDREQLARDQLNRSLASANAEIDLLRQDLKLAKEDAETLRAQMELQGAKQEGQPRGKSPEQEQRPASPATDTVAADPDPDRARRESSVELLAEYRTELVPVTTTAYGAHGAHASTEPQPAKKRTLDKQEAREKLEADLAAARDEAKRLRERVKRRDRTISSLGARVKELEFAVEKRTNPIGGPGSCGEAGYGDDLMGYLRARLAEAEKRAKDAEKELAEIKQSAKDAKCKCNAERRAKHAEKELSKIEQSAQHTETLLAEEQRAAQEAERKQLEAERKLADAEQELTKVKEEAKRQLAALNRGLKEAVKHQDEAERRANAAEAFLKGAEKRASAREKEITTMRTRITNQAKSLADLNTKYKSLIDSQKQPAPAPAPLRRKEDAALRRPWQNDNLLDPRPAAKRGRWDAQGSSQDEAELVVYDDRLHVFKYELSILQILARYSALSKDVLQGVSGLAHSHPFLRPEFRAAIHAMTPATRMMCLDDINKILPKMEYIHAMCKSARFPAILDSVLPRWGATSAGKLSMLWGFMEACGVQQKRAGLEAVMESALRGMDGNNNRGTSSASSTTTSRRTQSRSEDKAVRDAQEAKRIQEMREERDAEEYWQKVVQTPALPTQVESPSSPSTFTFIAPMPQPSPFYSWTVPHASPCQVTTLSFTSGSRLSTSCIVTPSSYSPAPAMSPGYSPASPTPSFSSPSPPPSPACSCGLDTSIHAPPETSRPRADMTSQQ